MASDRNLAALYPCVMHHCWEASCWEEYYAYIVAIALLFCTRGVLFCTGGKQEGLHEDSTGPSEAQNGYAIASFLQRCNPTGSFPAWYCKVAFLIFTQLMLRREGGYAYFALARTLESPQPYPHSGLKPGNCKDKKSSGCWDINVLGTLDKQPPPLKLSNWAFQRCSSCLSSKRGRRHPRGHPWGAGLACPMESQGSQIWLFCLSKS